MKNVVYILLMIFSATAVAQNDVVKIGGMPCNYPYYFKNDKGAPDGYIPAVTKAIMEDAGLSYVIAGGMGNFMYHYNGVRSIEHILAYNDLCMTGVINFRKRIDIHYSIPYLAVQFYVLSPRGISYNGLYDLVDKRIGVAKHHASESRLLINRENLGNEVVYDSLVICDNLAQGFTQLNKGELDYMLISEQCIVTQREVIDEKKFTISYSNFSPLYMTVASKDEKLIEKINHSISKLQNQNVFKTLFSEYVLPSEYIESDNRRDNMLLIFAAVILFLFGILYVCHLVIRYKVAKIKELSRNLKRSLSIGKISIWKYDSKTQVIRLTSKATGYKSITVKQDVNFENVHSEDRERVANFVQTLKEGRNNKTSGQIKFRLLNNQVYQWIYYTAEVFRNKAGFKWVGVSQEIDEIEDARVDLQRGRESLIYIADNAPFAIFIKDLKTQEILYHNKALLSFGDFQGEVNIRSIVPLLTNVDLSLEQIKSRDEIALTKKTSYSYNQYIKYKTGETHCYYVNKSRMYFEDRECLLTVVFDYKEQARLETTHKFLDFYIPFIKAYTWSYDSRTDLFMWSSGYDTKDLSIAKYMKTRERRAELIHPDYRELFFTTISDLLTGKKDMATIAFLSNVEDMDEYEWWEGHARAERITRDDQEFVMLHGFNININKRICDEKALKQAKEKAEESERMKSMFLANMSHEIRTPLNAIVGFSSLLPDAKEEDKHEYVSLIQTNNDILLNIISDILDLSKIDAGMEIHRENINLACYFNDLAHSLEHRLNNPNVEFIIENPYEVLECYVDKGRIGQVVANFVTNAIKHTEKGYIKVGYYFKDGMLEMYVEDTGCGVPKEKQHLLFKRFQKLDEFTQGAGLGLSIVAAIMDKFEGDYGFESLEGIGSRFWVRTKIHMSREEMPQEVNKNASKTSVPTRIEDSTNLRILVVEDIYSNYLLIKRLLAGYSLTHVENGEEAVKSVRNVDYDLVLMDIAMPVMNGLDATKAIRKFDVQIPIIAVTANAFASDRSAALEAGCNELVTKPLVAHELIKSIQAVVEK